MALQPLPIVPAVPSAGTKPTSSNSVTITNASGLRVLSVCTGGSGKVFLARYEPEADDWYPYAEDFPMSPDSTVNGGKFSGRYALERTGPVQFALVAAVGVYTGLTLNAAKTFIEGVQL